MFIYTLNHVLVKTIGPVQFMSDIFSQNGGVVVWVDLMKFGRLAGHELDTMASTLKKVLSRKSSHSCAFLLAPFLSSDKVSNGIRGEVRTVVFVHTTLLNTVPSMSMQLTKT